MFQHLLAADGHLCNEAATEGEPGDKSLDSGGPFPFVSIKEFLAPHLQGLSGRIGWREFVQSDLHANELRPCCLPIVVEPVGIDQAWSVIARIGDDVLQEGIIQRLFHADPPECGSVSQQ